MNSILSSVLANFLVGQVLGVERLIGSHLNAIPVTQIRKKVLKEYLLIDFAPNITSVIWIIG